LAGPFIIEKSATINRLLGIRSQRSSAISRQPEFHLSGFARIVLVVLVAEALGLLDRARFAVLADRHPYGVPDIK
jgi:hypothetical protein